MSDFWVRNDTAGLLVVGDLAGLKLASAEVYNLKSKFSDDEIAESVDLAALLGTPSTLVKLTGPSGTVIPVADAFDTVDLTAHIGEADAHHPHTNKTLLDSLVPEVIPTTQQLDKLDDIEEDATADQTPAEILAAVQSLPQPLDLSVQRLNGQAAAFYLDLANSSGAITAAQVSDFNGAADARINVQKGIAGGLATLDGAGAIPIGQIPASVLSGLKPKGTWNATTNTPNLGGLTPAEGDFYIVDVGGSTNLGGITDWVQGDWALFVNGVWQKSDHSDHVVSVNGQVGAVNLDTDDVAEGSSNLYHTDARVAASPAVAANTAKVSADGSIDTHSDVNLGSIAEGQLLRWSGGQLVPFTLPEIPVRGLEREYVSDLAVTTVTNTWTTKITQDFNFIAGNTYRVDWSYFWNGNSTGTDFWARILIDGIQAFEHRQEPKDAAGSFESTGTDQKHPAQGYFIFTPGVSGLVTLTLEFRNSGTANASMWDARIEKYRVE